MTDTVIVETAQPEAHSADALATHFAETREAAIKAVKDAVASATPEAPPEDAPPPPRVAVASEGASGADRPSVAAPPAEEPPPRPLAEILKAREDKRAARTAQAELVQELAAAKAARAEAEKAASETKAFLARLKADPKAAIQESGWDGERLILDLAKDGTAEGRLEAQLRAERERTAGLETKLDAFLRQQEEQQQRAAIESQRAGIQRVEQQFLTLALDGDKFPTLAKTFAKRPHLLLTEGHRIGAEYHRRTGEWASVEDVAEYLESEWAGDSGAPPPGPQAPAVGKGNGATQGKARGSATVTTSDASERRSIAVDPNAEMSDEDRIALAKRAAREAMRQHEAKARRQE